MLIDAKRCAVYSMLNDDDVIFVDAVDIKPKPVSTWKSDLPRPGSEMPWLLDAIVVDDDPIDSWLALQALRADMRVRHATASNSPGEILSQIAKGSVRPDLIFLDIRMPKIDGFRFLGFLRDIPATVRTPVVMLTTSRLERDVERVRTVDVRGYIVKSSNSEKLRERISDAITQALGKWRKQ
jgi:two-component system, response regulator